MKPTTIENENYGFGNGIGATPKSFLPKQIRSLDERKHIALERMKYWPGEDMYSTAIKESSTVAQVHQPTTTNLIIDDDESNSSYSSCISGGEGIKCTIHSFMKEVNTELDFQGRQINKILEDIRQSRKVRES